MAPLLEPSECILLVIEPVATHPATHDTNPLVIESRRRIERAARMCAVPIFFVANDVLQSSSAASVQQPTTPSEMPSTLEIFSRSWPDTPLGSALAATARPCLLLCGSWLDACVAFAALRAFATGYDTYVLTDATPSLDADVHDTALLRLVQAGIVPTTVRQTIREWAFFDTDPTRRRQTLDLLDPP